MQQLHFTYYGYLITYSTSYMSSAAG